jgi:hypothetical protein
MCCRRQVLGSIPITLMFGSLHITATQMRRRGWYVLVCILLQYLLCSYLTQYFVGPIYRGVEEGPQARATRPEDGPVQHRCCVCYGQRYPTWMVSECINYCLKLCIVSV